MAHRKFIRTWFVRVLCYRPPHLNQMFTLSGGFGVVPIVEYIEDGVTSFGMYHKPERQVFHFSHNDIETDLYPMFLRRSVDASRDMYCTEFIKHYRKTDGTSYTLEEAYLILIEGFFTARTVAEYQYYGVRLKFRKYDEPDLSKFATNMDETIDYGLEALNILRKLEIISVVDNGYLYPKPPVFNNACIVKLTSDITGYYVGHTKDNQLRINWPHFAMRFKDEISALDYMEKYRSDVGDIGYEIERLPIKVFVPNHYPY